MESYNAKIKNNPAVELVHLSVDNDPAAALKWAQDANLPWPTILLSDLNLEALSKPYFEFDPEVPAYILVDASGKELARGKQLIFQKLSTLK
ncbi:MAG: TlpA family protein disulfide reductase [Verrucomicrobiaceae bacterium]